MNYAHGFAVNKKILLIFAKQPLPGHAKTRLCPPLTPPQAASLAAAMLADVLAATAALSDVECWLCYAPAPGAATYFAAAAPNLRLLQQQGDDLGARLGSALATAFAAGAKQVAAIGSDAPDLPLACLHEAFLKLADPATDAIYGPSSDGGYYLVGMRRYWPALFTGIPWSSGTELAASLKRAANEGIAVTLLPEWHDLDTAADLAAFIARPSGAPHTRACLAQMQ